MKRLRIGMLSVVALVAVSLAGWAVASSGTAPAADEKAPAPLSSEVLATCQADGSELMLEPVGKGGGKPGGSACCDPDLEPGQNGNPFCFEGHTCCSDGAWRCNNPDATPSCDAGTVCDGSCGNRGDSCSGNSDCCSGNCGKNGRCR